MIDELKAKDMFELKDIYEVRERLIVCQTLIEHLRARKETRWHSFGENTDYPEESNQWLKYVKWEHYHILMNWKQKRYT